VRANTDGTYGTHGTYVIRDMRKPRSGFILPHGNYRELLSYKKAKVVYDVTFTFCGRFLVKGDRTIDQMIQAARSGKQNILEGSKASGTSKETEIKLTNTARASLEELLDDYQDYLRSRQCRLWEKSSREAQFVRQLAAKSEPAYEDFREFCETRRAEVVANIAICLIHQTNYLLDQQIRRLEHDFINEGGIRERMAQVRREQRRASATQTIRRRSERSP
ncbi:MAG TPA: four helix bundle suffix domain-containing protein, partial [Chthoniobacterales bacterium]